MKETSERPDLSTVRTVIERAGRAPSVHNTQPWAWVFGDGVLQLFADHSRAVPATDPGRRDLLISCGAVLHHARVAFAAAGWVTDVHRLGDPAHPAHLASIRFRPVPPSPENQLLDIMITRRRTDRRRFSSWEVPSGILDDLAHRAAAQGAIMIPVVDQRLRVKLTRAIAEAALRRETDREYARELASWAGPAATASHGIPSSNLPEGRQAHGDTVMRGFPGGSMREEALRPERDAGELAVIATSSDDELSQLRAGEAMSAVLLSATAVNLASCPLSQPLEVETTRQAIADQVLNATAAPQVILRLGWAPVSSPDLPPTPRRRVEDVLTIR